MPRKKRKARELTDEETMRKLFPKKVRESVKKTALDSRKGPSGKDSS
jgi:hypothetical protein